MSDFTKGEWQLADHDETFIYELNPKGSNKWSASIQPGWNEDSDRTSYNEMAAIGRLMKSAPDMYLALSAITEMYTAMINSGDCGNWNPEQDKEVIAARAALAKAKAEGV